MAQCQGKTRRGERCKREARPDSDFCSIHQDQEIRAPRERDTEWDTDAMIKAAIGVAAVGLIFLLRFRRC